MGTMELRTELINLIEGIENESLLKALYVMITHKSIPSGNSLKWEDLPEALKKELEEGMEQAENGEIVEHKAVMKKHEKWL